MSKSSNKTAEVLRFIQLYKSHEVLWNTNLPLYHRNDLRMQAYRQISFEVNMGYDDVKKKIKSLRTAYSCEISKIEKSKKSGGPLYVPTVFWFKEMAFLNDTLIRPVNVNKESTKYKESRESEPKSKKLKPNSSTDELVRLATQRLRTSQDSCQQIATVWANKLSKMERNQRIFAEKVINDVIFNGELGLLNYNTTLTNLSEIRKRNFSSSFNKNRNVTNNNELSQESHGTEYTINYDCNSNDEVLTDQESEHSEENYIVEDYDPLEDSVKLED